MVSWSSGQTCRHSPGATDMRGYSMTYWRKSVWMSRAWLDRPLRFSRVPSDPRLHGSFDHWLPVEIRGPVHQVEGPKQHGEDYPGHLVNLAHTVVSLFGVWGFTFRGLELHGRAVWNGGDGGVLGEAAGVSHAGRTAVVGLFGQSQRVLFLWVGGRNNHSWSKTTTLCWAFKLHHSLSKLLPIP